ncbi:MAG: filamentous hemagglutinin family protein [Rhodoferax sp.]|nr:filamentous hemagglutinin family protein [Rhodoferax sp.]
MRSSTCLCSLAVLLATGSLVCTGAWAVDPKALPTQASNWAAAGAGATYNAAGGTSTKPVGTVVLNNNATVLNWNSFNIGKDATVQFQMPSSTARVLNNVTGGALTPTQINGILNANGQVYIYDPRGIVFGQGSQVNVNSLVASSLRVDPNRFLNGILAPSIDPAFAIDPTLGYMPGAVIVEGDANGTPLQRAALTAEQNGFILLAAPQVQNSGDLKAPDGQVVLASGSKVYLAAPQDSSMRGFRVEVSNEGLDAMDAMAAKGANATNTVGGKIDVQRGNATLVGMAVNQMGAVSATTSVNLNGSIYLRAQGGASKSDPNLAAVAQEGGALVLGADSKTTITPPLSDLSTAAVTPAGPAFKPSQIDLTGKTVVLQGDAPAHGATIRAAGGLVNVTAQANPSAPASAPDAASKVELQSGSTIDVSGSAVQMAMESNVIAAELRGSELADNPLLRNSAVRGKTIYIDSRQALAAAGLNPADLSDLTAVGSGTLIADTSGYLKQLERNVHQNTTKGGSVKFTSDGSVNLQSDSNVNVSGGWVDYQTGHVNTSKLTLGGKLYDVQTAPADLPYDGVTRLADSSLNLELGYRQGASAGKVELTAPKVVLQGALNGSISTGVRQRDRSAADAPRGGQISLGTLALTEALALSQKVLLGGTIPSQADGNLALNASDLAKSGFDEISVLTSGSIDVLTQLALNPAGKLNLTSGADVQWKAGLTGAGASVSASANGSMTVASGATFDLAGRWQNDLAAANPVRDANGTPIAPIITKGGSLSLSANALSLGSAVTLDVSGGAWLSAGAKLADGKAGSIALSSVPSSTDALSGSLRFSTDLTLKGYGLKSGGSLSLSGRNVWIGDILPGDLVDPASDLVLAPSFFQTGGFTKYAVGGSGHLTLAANTALAPRAVSWSLGSTYTQRASGTIASVAVPELLPLAGPLGSRSASSVTLRAGGSSKLEGEDVGVLRMEQGSRITVDSGANVTLQALQALDVEGAVRAPGGAISLLLKSDGYNTGANEIAPKIWLGDTATLDASGTTDRTWVDGRGITQGTVSAGGSVVLGKAGTADSLTAASGVIAMAPGAVINVSGTSAADRRVLDGTQISAPQTLASDAGTIAISSDAALLVAGHLVAQAGGAGARGGKLDISAPVNVGGVAPVLTLGPSEGALLWSSDLTFADTATGAAYSAGQGKGVVNTPSFASGGFSRLSFSSGNAIALEPGTNLTSAASIRLDSPVVRAGRVGASGASMAITAPSVTLGVAATENQSLRTATGAVGSAPVALTVSADTLDLVGNSVTQGFSQVRLLASHDVRLQGVSVAPSPTATGSLVTGPELEIQAARVYPTTLTDFALRASATELAPSRLVVGTQGAAAPGGDVLSGAGTLTLAADSITQGGRVLAPFGQIRLEATDSIAFTPGSLTSVAGTGTVPLGLVNNGAEWSYSFGNRSSATFTTGAIAKSDQTKRSLPTKKISADAPTVTQAAGAVLDATGGGTLYGYGVSPGPGGSRDILSAPGTFAINPQFRGLTAPLDTNYGSAGLQVGDQIYLTASAGLAAGYYTLLPAHYALLDGGIAVVAQGTSASAGDNRLNADGSYTVAGSRSSNTDGRGDTRLSAFKLLTGTEVRRRTEFQDFSADSFFATQAASLGVPTPELPRDAGQLSFKVTDKLDLAGLSSLQGSTVTGNSGHAGLVDISAPRITVTADTTTQVDGAVRLLSNQLTDLGADSLLLGGRRTLADDGMHLQVDATSVRIDNDRDHPLQGLELLLVASDALEVTGRASLVAQSRIVNGASAAAQTAVDLNLVGTNDKGVTYYGTGAQADGALLRLSSAGAVNIYRDTPLGTTGRLTIADGAQVSGSGSMWLDATQDMSLQASLELAPNAAFALRSQGINLVGSEQSVAPAGLTLNGAMLAKLNALPILDLTSYSWIKSFGDVKLGSEATEQLNLRASSLSSDGSDLGIKAKSVALSGLPAVKGTVSASGGSGTLTVDAGTLTVGSGVLQTQGFVSTQLKANDGFVFDGSNVQLWVDNALTLSSPVITATPGTVAQTTAGGTLRLETLDSPSTSEVSGLGARIGFTGNILSVDTSIRAQAGQIDLSAANGVEVNGGTLDVSGVSMAFGSGMAYAPAGNIRVDAGQGNLALASAAKLDLSSLGADAGSLDLRATALGATVTLDATLLGTAKAGVGSSTAENPLQASFTLDTGTTPTGFDTLNALLNKNGFTHLRSVRVRSGDLDVGTGSSITARSIALSTDNGNLTVSGTLDASGPSGGTIDLYAASASGSNTGKLVLNGATLLANATQVATSAAGSLGDGGRINLGVSNTGDADGASLSLDAASTLSTLGRGLGADGEVHLRAPVNTDKTDVAVGALAATVETGALTLEAVQTYQYLGNKSLNRSVVDAFKADATAFMANAQTVQTRLSGPNATDLKVQPGVEVRATGNLTVSVDEQDSDVSKRGWNLADWRFGADQDVPGTLTLRAAGNLTVNGSISDGFDRVENKPMPQWALRSDDSWSMRLVAGGDLGAAAPLATTGTTGSLVLKFARAVVKDDVPSALLRTGTGRIDIAAAKNIELGKLSKAGGATIYTSGKRAVLPEDGSFAVPIGAAFGKDGGAISLRAGGNVVGVASAQTVNSWLFRQGRTETDSNGEQVFAKDQFGENLNTAWWSRSDYLGSGVATLAGGDITVTAVQGSVMDLTASIATNAYMPGSTPAASALVEQGGGDLRVRAGQNIAGGQFYVQKGGMVLRADGAVVAGKLKVLDNLAGENDSAYRAMRPVLALGDASAQVTAGGNLEIETVYNPTLTLQSAKNATVVNFTTAGQASSQYSNFLSYGPQSTVEMTSVGGDAVMESGSKLLLDASLTGLNLGDTSIPDDFVKLMALAPPSVGLAALSGSVRVKAGFVMAPASRGALDIYAKKDVELLNDTPILMLDASPTSLTSAAAPSLLNGSDLGTLIGKSMGLAAHTSGGLHSGDDRPARVVASQGDITGLGTAAAMINVPKRLEIQAGRDIVDMGFVAQNLETTDVTSVVAGRNFTNSTNYADSSPVNQVLAGPGLLLLNTQNGSIDLGNSAGVVTRGNLDNPYLPSGGAAIEAVAGVALSAADLARTPAQTEAQNAALFANISYPYSDDPDTTYNKNPNTTKQDRLNGFDAAIATQFPSPVSGSGSILSYGSQFKTEQGGSVDLWAPGQEGSVVAGLVSIPFYLQSKTAADTGIFTVRGGAIRSLVGKDFIVNQGRVFTLGGGDISLVSQNGDIDAGRGAKTAGSAPPPLLTTDASGNTKLDIAGSISGSGIATLRTSETQASSDVLALAPRGVFDAGDAGVRSTGQVAIQAAVVLNANNISASGGVSGSVAVASTASAAPPSTDTASAATQAAAKQTSGPQAQTLALTVDVLGYGDVTVKGQSTDMDETSNEDDELDATGQKKRKARKAN